MANAPKPAPVDVTNVEPIPVTLDPLPATREQTTARTVAALSQSEADILSSEGQRAINRLWERTQAIIAISIVEVTLVVVAVLIVAPLFRATPDEASKVAAVTGLVLLSNLVGNVTGSYFTRTNHTKTGGVIGVSGRRGE